MELDFYVYGGFDVTVNAFSRIAMIFNDGEYVVLFFVATVFGIFFGGMITLGQSLLGKGGDGSAVINFLILVFVGVAIFKGLILPKGTIHIYDPVVNRYQAIGGVPNLIIFSAGMTNKAERVLTEVLDNGSAHPRSLQGGGIGLELLINAFRGEPLGHEAYIQKSINSYIESCLPPAASLNSYTFDLQQLKSDTSDIKAELAKLKNPSVFTVIYSATNKAGTTMSCTDAWDSHLNTTLNSTALYEEYVEHVCAQSGFAVHGGAAAAQMNRCQVLLEDAQDLMFDATASGDYRKFMQDIMLSKSIVSSLMQNPGSALSELANKDITATGFSSQIVSEGWLPAIKAIVFGVVLGLMPVIALFIVTPMVFKAVHLMLGLTLWLALWGVCDAVVHGIAMDQVISMTAGVKNLNMSLGALLMLPDHATKGLAILGKAQSMGVILSTFIAGVFFKISGYAFTQLSEKWSQDIDRFGDKAGQDALDPVNRTEMLQRQMEAQSKMTAMGHLGMADFGMANQMLTSAPYNQASSQVKALQGSGYSGQQALTGNGVFEGAGQAGSRIAQDTFADSHFGGNLSDSGARFGGISRTIELEESGGKADALQSVHDDKTLAQAARADSAIRHTDQLAATDARAQALQTVHSGNTLTEAAKIDSAIHSSDQVASTAVRGDLAQHSGATMTDGFTQMSRFDQAPLSTKMDHYGSSQHYQQTLATSEDKFAGEMRGFAKVGNISGQGVTKLAEASGMSQAYSAEGTRQAYTALNPAEIVAGYEHHELANAADGNVVSQIAASEGYASTKDYIDEQKQLGKSEELANLINAERFMGAMGWDHKDVALAKNGTNWEMALTGEQMGSMVNAGMFTPQDGRYYDDGGLLNMNMANDGSVISAFAKTGTSEQVNDSLEVSRGLQFNQGAGEYNPGSFAYALENRMDETALDYANLYQKMNDPAVRESTLSSMAQELDNTMHSSVTYQDVLGHREDIAASVGIPGIAQLISGADASVSASAYNEGSVADQDTYGTNKLVLNSLYNQASSDAQNYIEDVYRPHATNPTPQAIEKVQDSFAAERFAGYYSDYRDSMLQVGNEKVSSSSDHYDDNSKPASSNPRQSQIDDLQYQKKEQWMRKFETNDVD